MITKTFCTTQNTLKMIIFWVFDYTDFIFNIISIFDRYHDLRIFFIIYSNSDFWNFQVYSDHIF